MSAFMQGLQTGSQTARGWIDTYEAARKRREEADLKSRREGILTAQPEYSQGYTVEQGQQLEAMASAINPQTGRPYYNVQAGQGGNYTVTPDFTEAQTPRTGMDTGSQYGVAPVELQTTGLGRAGVVSQPIPFNQQRVANFLGGRVEGDLTPERMETMRSRALANTIADPMERQRALIQMDANERAAARDAQDKELTGLRIDRERDTVTREQKNREATQALSQQLSSGNPPDVTQIYKLASDFGVDPAPLVKLAADNLGLDEKAAKAATEKLVKQINSASTSPDKFRALLDTVADPDPLDNIKPELRETKGGYRVFYGDRAISPEFKESKDMTALQQLAGFYRDAVSGKPMETAITMATLDAKRAATDASRSTTNLANVRARGLQADDATQVRLKDIRDQFTALTPEQKLGPEGRALEREYNMVTSGPGKQVSTGAAPRPEVTAAAVVEYAKGLVGKPSGVMEKGKPVKYTAETAAAAARRALSAQDGAAAPADPADALIAAMRANAPAQPLATPAGQSLVNLSNAMLPPAAAPRTAPVTSQERLRGLYLGQ